MGTGGGEHGAGKWSSLSGLYPEEKMTSVGILSTWFPVRAGSLQGRAHSLGSLWESSETP